MKDYWAARIPPGIIIVKQTLLSTSFAPKMYSKHYILYREPTMNIEESAQPSISQVLSKTGSLLMLVTAAWVATTAIIGFGPRLWWNYDVPFTIAAVILNFSTGLLMLTAFFRHMKSMDELQRQTHLESMAITLGLMFILTVSYGSLEPAGLIVDAHPANLLFIAAPTYITLVIAFWLRRTRG